VLGLALLLQLQGADSIYSSAALREFIARASIANRAPPLELAGYSAQVESELALVLRDSLGRELVGQLEQLAARAEWQRDGRYELHVVGYRSQSAGAPYSALSFTRMYTVPTLFGNRLFIGMNDGLPRTRADSVARQKRLARDSLARREPFRAVHPLATDRDRYYRFSGGDTAATLHAAGREIRIVRVHVEPVSRPGANFVGFRGELDFDADRHQLVRLRARLVEISDEKLPFLVRGTGAVAMAYLEFENAEINGKYWLPTVQRSEFQAQMGILGDTRPIYRIITRFRNYRVSDSAVVSLAQIDSEPPAQLPPTRSKLSFASKDSVSRYGDWQENLGTASGRIDGDDFDDLAPDVWKQSGKPRVDHWPSRLEDIARYNRVEGFYTGAAASVRFRDHAPGVTVRANAGYAWSERTVRGALGVTQARGKWINGARIERALVSTNDFLLPFENGLSISPLLFGTDAHDYVTRWTGALSTTRIVGNVDRALLSAEAAYVREGPEVTRVNEPLLYGDPFRANRNAVAGDYARATAALEFHPRVTGESLSPGFGARAEYEIATGDLDWQRVEIRLATRQYWRGLVFASRIDAGAVFGDPLPPQVMYEIGGTNALLSYDYKEFGGDRAAIGRGLVAYYFPFLRTPVRLARIVLPGLAPGIGTGVQGGWTEASSAAARAALLALGDGITPPSVPTGRVRATGDVRLTFLSGAIGVGFARPLDHVDKWKPFFLWGASF
jgi:hypothetical protein